MLVQYRWIQRIFVEAERGLGFVRDGVKTMETGREGCGFQGSELFGWGRGEEEKGGERKGRRVDGLCGRLLG